MILFLGNICDFSSRRKNFRLFVDQLAAAVWLAIRKHPIGFDLENMYRYSCTVVSAFLTYPINVKYHLEWKRSLGLSGRGGGEPGLPDPSGALRLSFY